MRIAHHPLSSYTVILPAAALEGERDVAEVLCDVVTRATGYTLPIATEAATPAPCEIVIGETARDTDKVRAARQEIRNDGYALVVDGDRLFITGNLPRGGVYGVYTFLEEYLGARFYSDTFMTVHKGACVDVPADLCRVDSPHFFSRDTYWYHILHPRRPTKMNIRNALKSNHWTMPDLGGGVSYAGRFVHSIWELAEIPHEIGVQPCLTDERIYENVRKNVRRVLRENPAATIVSVSQVDSYPDQLGCQCERCKAIDDREGTPMGSLLTFVNRIADDIKDDYPHVYVDTLAYRYTRKAPKHIKPRDNVIIRLCSIECCFAHPLSDESCYKNKEFKKDIEAWAAICDNLYIWDYTYNAETYFSYFPNFDVLWDNVNFYKDHSVTGVFLEGQQVSVSGEFAELRSYLLAKLLWDPDMTKEEYYAYMDEFLQYYYGAGWEKIKEYMTSMAAHAIRNNTHLGIFDKGDKMYPAVDENGKRDTKFSRNMLTLWEEAYALAETEEQKAHVEKSSIQAYYLCHLSGPSAERKKHLKTVYELCEKYGIEYYKYVIPMPDKSNAGDLNSLI